MLEHCGVEYEYISEASRFSEVFTRFGKGDVDCFAPPCVVDGDYVVSQSTAASLYLGNKLGLNSMDAFDVAKAVQYMADIIDTFELNVGRKNEDGASLHELLTGGRFGQLMNNIENGIKGGPYYFGSAPSCVDFFPRSASRLAHCEHIWTPQR